MTKIPKYRKHPSSDRAFVEINKKRRYLPGKHNSGESLEAYSVWIKKFHAGTLGPLPKFKVADVTVGVLVGHFLRWAKINYQKNGRTTGSHEKFKEIIVPVLVNRFRDLPVENFGPNALKQVRQDFVDKGNCRKEVNRRTNLVKRIFNWGVELVTGLEFHTGHLTKSGTPQLRK